MSINHYRGDALNRYHLMWCRVFRYQSEALSQAIEIASRRMAGSAGNWRRCDRLLLAARLYKQRIAANFNVSTETTTTIKNKLTGEVISSSRSKRAEAVR